MPKSAQKSLAQRHDDPAAGAHAPIAALRALEEASPTRSTRGNPEGEIQRDAERLANLACLVFTPRGVSASQKAAALDEIGSSMSELFRLKTGSRVLASIGRLGLHEHVPAAASLLRSAAELACSTPVCKPHGATDDAPPGVGFQAHTILIQVGIFGETGSRDPRHTLSDGRGFGRAGELLKAALAKRDPNCKISFVNHLYTVDEINKFSFQTLHDLPACLLRSTSGGAPLTSAELMLGEDGTDEDEDYFYAGPMVRYLLAVVWTNHADVSKSMRQLWPRGKPVRMLQQLSNALDAACVDPRRWSFRALGVELFFDSYREGVRWRRAFRFKEQAERLMQRTEREPAGCFYEIRANPEQTRERCPIVLIESEWLEHLGEVAWPVVTFDPADQQIMDLSRLLTSIGMRPKSNFIVSATSGMA